jgi:flagellar hook-associated protein FlgK
VENNADSQTASAVQTINGYLQQIAALNQQYVADFDASQDAGLDAQMHAPRSRTYLP